MQKRISSQKRSKCFRSLYSYSQKTVLFFKEVGGFSLKKTPPPKIRKLEPLTTLEVFGCTPKGIQEKSLGTAPFGMADDICNPDFFNWM